MQFKVPQFIDIEDKVFGPLTFKQFAYLAGGAGFGYLAFRWLPTLLAIIVGPALVAFALALAFFKYNEKPFIHVVESFVKFYTRSRLYLWHKQEKIPVPVKPGISFSATNDGDDRATMSGSKLKTLSWSLDVIDPKNTQ
jgi:hypothetical protein